MIILILYNLKLLFYFSFQILFPNNSLWHEIEIKFLIYEALKIMLLLNVTLVFESNINTIFFHLSN